MAAERHPSKDLRLPADKFADNSSDTIRSALAGSTEQRRELAAWLLGVVDREVRIVLRPIAVRYRRDLRDVAEDFVQDILIAFFHDDGHILRTWDPARGMRLPSFVGLVVRRYVYRRFRGFRGNPWSSEPSTSDDLTAHLEDGISTTSSLFTDIEYRLQLDAVLGVLHGELSERDWRLFTRVFVEQHSPTEVAREEGMSENSIHKWSSRFHQRVRRLFSSSGATRRSGPLAVARQGG